jgi:hypothetical protein
MRAESSKVEEKRENFFLRNPEKEKSILLLFLKFPIQKVRKLFSEKTEKSWRRRKREGSATFLLHLGKLNQCSSSPGSFRKHARLLFSLVENFCHLNWYSYSTTGLIFVFGDQSHPSSSMGYDFAWPHSIF